MQRRSFIRNTGLTAGLLALSSKDLMAAFVRQPAYKIKMLRGDVGIFSEKGGTIGFHTSTEGFTVIDTQFADTAPHLIDELKKQHELSFKWLINTHHHGDHTGGNIAFKDLAQHVVGHENCLNNYKRVSEQNKNADKQLFQDTTFSDSWQVKTGKESIKAYYFGAGHTNGDAVIHFEQANVAHMGDLLFNRMHPYIDRSAGASIRSWTTVLQRIRETFSNDTIFIFGHAADPEKVTGTKADLVAFENYLNKLWNFVESEIKAGKTKEDIIKNTEIPGMDWQASGATRSLTAAYEEITASK